MRPQAVTIVRAVSVIALLLTGARSAVAQHMASETRVLVGPGLGVYQANSRGGAGKGFGATVLLERAITRRVALRGSFAAFKTFVVRDGGVACPPDPPCGDLGFFPDEVVTGSVQTAVKAHTSVPLSAIGALGVTIPTEGHENVRGGPLADSRAGPRATYQFGIELVLGRSRRAPRLQLIRSGYSRSIYSMNWLDALFVVFPL